MVEPELLDELAFDDPEALRSRRDIRLINKLLGNLQWLRDQLERERPACVVELGAGDGGFLEALNGEGRRLTGVDLAPRPAALREEIEWVQGDARELLAGRGLGGSVVIANLLLHQFGEEDLRAMGRAMRESEAIFASEPLRSRRAVTGLSLLRPLVNRVTWHDGLVSIRAGFRPGELPPLLGLSGEEWEIEESCTLVGAYRLSARRRR